MDSGAPFLQTVVLLSVLSGKTRLSQGSEFYGGAVGEPENFYSAGKTILQRGLFSEDKFQLSPFKIWQNLTCLQVRDTISFISESAG